MPAVRANDQQELAGGVILAGTGCHGVAGIKDITNEEAMSMIEELRSANAKLQTSQAELQSLNEELTTVNNQLKQAEQEVLKIADAERRRIGQDLHDVTGQELTGLGLIADTLVDALQEYNSPEVELAIKVNAGVRRVLSQVRTQSRGLIPVEIDAAGLMAALADLAVRIREQAQADCVFQCDDPVLLDDNVTATHLYRIAQEAVTNALKHALARRITISLGLHGEQIMLNVRDDGCGFHEPRDESAGMGLRIMRYRAGLIRAKLEVVPLEGGGTLVRCVLGTGGRGKGNRSEGGRSRADHDPSA